jgi:hypothetical protein
MGLQDVEDVTLVRHAYVRTIHRRRGIGGRLLSELRSKATRPLLVGTWAAADWILSPARVRDGPTGPGVLLLRRYWSVPEKAWLNRGKPGRTADQPVGALQGPCQQGQGRVLDATICDCKLEASDWHLMSIGRARGIWGLLFPHGKGVGHGSGLGGAHGHRIWHGRSRRACCWGFHGRLWLCLSRGSSGRGGREATRTPAGD